MMEHGHNTLLVLASFGIALISGFTGLTLTRGASALPIWRRKVVVAMSAVVLGSGIWSMHFVAMLGMRMPVQFYYDALTTLISALVAILLTGVALLLVHFGDRTPRRIALAGVATAVGIVAMHYLGMSGIQLVRPIYSTGGIVFALVSALVLCVASFWISYGRRESRNILLGTLGFGISVFAVHFIAMAGTHFAVVDGATKHPGLWMTNDTLAFGVTLSAFVLSGAFLLVGVTFASKTQLSPPPAAVRDAPPEPAEPVATGAHKIPFERQGRIHFVPDDEVYAVQAEGRYTFLYHQSGRLFCPWAISDFATKLAGGTLVQCHRSYLVNPARVDSFERKKDNGVCHFAAGAPLAKLPVSRSYLKAMRDRLGV